MPRKSIGRLRQLNGLYYWRRTHPTTGKRVQRATGTNREEIARKMAGEWDEEFERAAAGLEDLTKWRRPLEPLIGEWLQDLETNCESDWPRTRRNQIRRVTTELALITCADLSSLASLAQRLKAIGKKRGLGQQRLHRQYQEPLKALSKWLFEDGKYLEHDPLAGWASLDKGIVRDLSVRRAFWPLEVARAFAATDWLDLEVYGRAAPTRMAFTLLLLTAPRSSALCSRDAAHFLRKQRRIDFGPSRGKKRRGTGALDDQTAAELEDYLRDRRDGPLLLSPRGSRLRVERLLDYWRESFGLGLVHELAPDVRPMVAFLAVRRLLDHLGKSSKRPRKRIAKPNSNDITALELANAIQKAWLQKMEGVDVHAFRKTHRTWARGRRVPGEAIDRQLGHAAGDNASLSIQRAIAGSMTGRKHYTDASFFDPRESAQAVRGVLDAAVEKINSAATGNRKSQSA